MIEIRFDTSRLHKWRLLTDRTIRTRAAKIVSASGFRIQAAAKEGAPVDVGRLRAAIQVSKPDPFTARITAGVNYAQAIEEGRKPGTWPHMGALRLWATRVLGDASAAFPIALTIFRKGQKARPFMRPAFNKERPKFVRNIKKLFQ